MPQRMQRTTKTNQIDLTKAVLCRMGSGKDDLRTCWSNKGCYVSQIYNVTTKAIQMIIYGCIHNTGVRHRFFINQCMGFGNVEIVMYRVNQKKFPLLKFVAPRLRHGFESFKFQLKVERSKCFCDFSRCPTSTRSIGKFNFIKILWLQNDGKGSETLIKSY